MDEPKHDEEFPSSPDEAFRPVTQLPTDAGRQAELLHEQNEERILALELTMPTGKGSLENAFDALKMITYLENIAATLEITDVTLLDFEGRRADMLDKIEQKMAEMKEAHEAARARQVLTGGLGGPGAGPGPGATGGMPGPGPGPRRVRG